MGKSASQLSVVTETEALVIDMNMTTKSTRIMLAVLIFVDNVGQHGLRPDTKQDKILCVARSDRRI